MTEPKIRWRAKFDALSVELATVAKDNVELTEKVNEQAAYIESLQSELDEARKKIDRARIEGMHDATGLILRDEK